MKQIKFKNQPVLVIADIHGNFAILYNYLIENNIKNCILIIAGDIGLGFYKNDYYQKMFSLLNNVLKENNAHLILMRGNHDDPSYFNEEKINFSNVKTIQDYTIISVGDKNILCVGGAISIDRKSRKEKMMCESALIQGCSQKILTKEEIDNEITHEYWEDEIPIYNEDKLSEIYNNIDNIDFVITHTSPSFCFKYDKVLINSFIKNDKNLENDLIKERHIIDLLYNNLVNNQNKIQKWVYGHFHSHNNDIINNIEFIALANADNTFDYTELIH